MQFIAQQAAEKLVWPVIPRSPPFLLAEDDESRIGLKTLRARFLAQFTLSGQSEILRCAQDDSEGLGMTAWKGFSAACQAANYYGRTAASVMGPYISGRRAAMRSNSHCPGTRTTRLRSAPIKSRSAQTLCFSKSAATATHISTA